MPCPGGCGSNQTYDPQLDASRRQLAQNQATQQLNDSDLVMCKYTHSNIGEHRVFGAAMINGRQMDYGYRKGGDQFLVHKHDIALAPHLFQPVIVETPIASQPVRKVNWDKPITLDEEIPDLTAIIAQEVTKTRRPRRKHVAEGNNESSPASGTDTGVLPAE